MTRPAPAGTCKHCRTPVIRDLSGCWVHASLSHVCRDQWGTYLTTTATPGRRDDNATTRR